MVGVKRQRQAVIVELINSSSVTSQHELVEALRDNGYAVSQTTISRDLKELGLNKLRDTKGAPRYTSSELAVPGAESEAALMRMARQFLLSAEKTGNIVVLKTSPGNAQGLAAAIDTMVLEGIAGTVAGDDTVLVVCSEGVDSGKVGDKLIGYTKSQR